MNTVRPGLLLAGVLATMLALGLSDASGARGLLQRCRRKLTRALRQELEGLGHGSSFFLKTW